jgi:hypothetical protein
MHKNLVEQTFKHLPEFLESLTNPDDPEGVIKKLRQREFTLSDAKVSSRLFNLWKNIGVVELPDNLSSKWVKLDFIDYIWLCLVKDMRSIGLSIESIKKIKQILFAELALFNEAILPEKDLKEKFIGVLTDKISKSHSKAVAKSVVDEMLKELGDKKLIDFLQESWPVKFNQLEYALYAKQLFNHEASLIIFMKQGLFQDTDKVDAEIGEVKTENTNDNILQVILWTDSFKITNPDLVIDDLLVNQFHIRIPISTYISDFVKDSKKKEESLRLGWLTPAEYELLQHIRNDAPDTITIKFREKNIEMIQVSTYHIPNLENKLLKVFGDNGYGEITYVFANGKKQSIKINRKFKTINPK